MLYIFLIYFTIPCIAKITKFFLFYYNFLLIIIIYIISLFYFYFFNSFTLLKTV